MKRSNLLRLVTTILLLGSFDAWAQTDTPQVKTLANAQTKTALAAVEAGKRATALVDTPDANGSAFCIHESGIFATNAHVVEEYSSVKVVVDSGEATQRILTARVSHCDTENDLAVLIADPPLKVQAPDMPPLAVLPLGDSNALFETMPVAVFGFPLGIGLALDEKEMPSVTVTTGRITALRKLQGKLKEMQLDAATNPGNSGGPVINEQGQAVGVIYAGVNGAQGLNFAIPIEILRGLLSVPEIRFDHPPIPWNNRVGPKIWTAQVVPFTTFTGGVPQLGTTYDLSVAVGLNGIWRDLDVSRVLGGDPNLTEFRIAGSPLLAGEERYGPPDYKLTLRQYGKIVTEREGVVEVTDAPDMYYFPRFVYNGPTVPPATNPTTNPATTNPTTPRTSERIVPNPANGHWYECVSLDQPLNFQDALTAAKARTHNNLPGHLVTITSADEQQFVMARFAQNFRRQTDKAWIGGFQKPNSIEPDQGWSWTTGEPWKYSNWEPGEPNNTTDQGEDFLEIGANGLWNDAGKSLQRTLFLVEYEPPIANVAVAPGGAVPTLDTPRVDGDKTIIDLSSPITAAVSGGGGRFLLFYLKAEQRVALFDALEKKIVRYIAAPGDNVLLAASQDKLVLLLTDQNILQRWDLQTGQREQSVPLPDDKPVTSMAMGAASNGPLLVVRGNTSSFLDLDTLQTMEMIDDRTGQPDMLLSGGITSAAPDGSVFAIANASVGARRQIWILAREGKRLSKYTAPGSTVAVMPSFDGRWLFTGTGIFTGEGKPVVADQFRDGGQGGRGNAYQTTVPAFSPAYFVALKNPNSSPSGGGNFGGVGTSRGQRMELNIYSANDRRLLASLGTLDEIKVSGPSSGFGFAGRDRPAVLPLEKRVYYLPDRNLLVTVGDGMDQLVIRQIDLKKLMSQGGNKFLFVASTPPRKVTKGSFLTYQLDVQSQAGGTKYRVESGPPGLTITPTGLVEWKVPADFADAEATVLISISDNSGQELYHTFKIQIK